MAQSDLRSFIQDLFLRYDSEFDLSEGSRVQTDLIEPLLTRIGIDPFDQDIHTFVIERLRQAFPDLAIEESDALRDTLVDPMRVLLEPIVREVRLIKLRSSLGNIESLSDGEVDALLANFFESRQAGGYARGRVRIYFANPLSITLSAANPARTRGGLRFFPVGPQQITTDVMLLNQEGGEYFFDVNYVAEARGDEYNVEAYEITSVANLPTATRVRNLRRFQDGLPRESSTEYAARVERGLSDRTLTVSRGIVSEVSSNFPDVRALQVIGFRDPEMQRDVVRGGGMGTVLEDDILGKAHGNDASFPDDVDGDATTQRVTIPTGEFVTRVATVGSDPGESYLTLAYPEDASFVMRDVRILEVLSNTQVRVDQELPVGLTTVPWGLRRRKLTLSHIPGGIALPNTAQGTLELQDDVMHIGGKTDLYVAGPVQEETAYITSLADASPMGRGFAASTGTDLLHLDYVLINDPPAGVADRVEPGMSLVLDEGVDAGSYRVQQILSTSPLVVRLSLEMTGVQSNLSWKLVDEIDVDLTDPQDVKIEGADLLVAAGSTSVSTASATSFLGANVQVGDVLRIVDDTIGGDYTIEAVIGAATLTLDPAPARSGDGIRYSIFRKSEGLLPPVVRVVKLELLDSGGAPTGTQIPYRDPVIVQSRSFQNEGSDYFFEGTAIVGLVSKPLTNSMVLDLETLEFLFYDPARVFAGTLQAPYLLQFPFSSTTWTPAEVVAELNGDATLQEYGVRATVLTYEGQNYLGLSSTSLLRIGLNGSTNEIFGFSEEEGYLSSNAQVRALNPSSLVQYRVRLGDLLEFLEGNNLGAARVIREPSVGTPTLARDTAVLGVGPFGPIGTEALYDNQLLLPEINVRTRIGRPSVGSVRAYFLAPTSAEFRYATTQIYTELNEERLNYRPDPELRRTMLPAPPTTGLPAGGVASSGSDELTFVDEGTDFLTLGLLPGDVLELKYQPIVGSGALPSAPTTYALAGTQLRIRLGTEAPYVTIAFPTNNFDRTDVVDYINEQVGEDIASIDNTGRLVLQADLPLSIDSTSTVLLNSAPNHLYLAGLSRYTNQHVETGEYIVGSIEDAHTLMVSEATPFSGTERSNSQYQVQRYVQRISSTEMNQQQDETGLYYVDVELVSVAPGNRHNLHSNIALEMKGHASDGYRLSTDNETLSFSRAEVLRAEISRTLLLVGSSDNPEEYVQLSQQNVLVTYERSPTVDDVQSFCDSDYSRVLTQEILVRHLLPSYVRTNWVYEGGAAEVDVRRLLTTYLDQVSADATLEVGDLKDVVRRAGAKSIYATSAESKTGRTAPVLVVLEHGIDRGIRGAVVTDVVSTENRLQRFLPDELGLKRLAAGR